MNINKTPILLIVVTSLLFVLCGSVSAGTKVIDYGFEDWTGDNGNVSPAPNYIFGTSYEGYWTNHRNGTEVVASGDNNCGGRTARSGNYYWHHNFYTGAVDDCLGTQPTSLNSANNIGKDYSFPTGEKNTFSLSSIQSNIITIRFYFRVTGDWSSNQTDLDGGAGLKFIRLYGGDGAGDDSSMLLKILNTGDSSTPEFAIGALSGYTFYNIPINWQDGNWHSVTMITTRNNDTNSGNNITIQFWVDDWDGTGTGYTRSINVADAGSSYDHIAVMTNWSNRVPVNDLGLDMDDFEVWDGLPTSCVDVPAGPPGDVTNESASYLTQNDLVYINAAWTNPSDADFKGTMVRYNISGSENYPQVHTEGTLGVDVIGGTEGTFNITSPGMYWISYFTYDECGNYSQTAHVSLEVPVGVIPDSSPVVTITQPTSGDSYTSSGSSINISGTASDDSGVTSVSWENNRGGGGDASGTTSWSVTNIALFDGVNIITVTTTDTNNQTSTDVITVNVTASDVVQTWGAEEQTGQTGWSDSSATWCVRVPLIGSSVMNSGNQVKISFKGRASGDYRVRKASIAERDTNGGLGAVVDSTWTRVTFDGNSADVWSTNGALVPEGGEKISDPVSFDIQSGKEYYVTFMLESPSSYLSPSTDQSELYYDGIDHSDDIDWTGYSVRYGRLHALYKVYATSCDTYVAPVTNPEIR